MFLNIHENGIPEHRLIIEVSDGVIQLRIKTGDLTVNQSNMIRAVLKAAEEELGA